MQAMAAAEPNPPEAADVEAATHAERVDVLFQETFTAWVAQGFEE